MKYISSNVIMVDTNIEKRRDPTSRMTNALKLTMYRKKKNKKTVQKCSITQRLRTDLGRSVQTISVIQPVWFQSTIWW